MVKFQPSKLAMRVRFPLPAPFLRVKTFLIVLAAFAGPVCGARADLTIVEKVEGAAPTSAITIKIKGDKAKIEGTSRTTTIIDAKNGEITHLINDRKLFIRMSNEKVRAAMEMVNRFDEKADEKPKLTPSGKKATINGYEAEEYNFDSGKTKAAFWLAPKYPDAPAILKQLHVLNAGPWKMQNAQVPDYNDLPGVPLKFVSTMGGLDLITTVTSIKEDPLSDSEFDVPADFQEMKSPKFQKPWLPAQTPSPEPSKP